MNQKISLRLYNKEKKDALHLIKNFWNSVPLPFLTLPSLRTPPEPGRQGQPADAAHPAGIPPDPPGDSRCGVGAAGGCGARGNSKRPEGSPNRYRSDSSGMLYAFPIQRSSGSVRVALRLTRPPGLRNAKIFSRFFRCPPYTLTTCPGLISGFRLWKS